MNVGFLQGGLNMRQRRTLRERIEARIARKRDDDVFLPREFLENGREALRDCIAAFQESGRTVPKPSVEAAQWRQRLPRTLYLKLTRQAESEGVSINSLVTAIIAEANGSRQARSSKERSNQD